MNRNRKTRMKYARTNRGFTHIEFVDLYGQRCSFQNSSLATEAAIWLGVDFGIPKNDGNPGDEVHERMHLTQAMAKQVVKVLERFIATGSVAKERRR